VAADFFPDLIQAIADLSRQTDALVVTPPSLIPLLGQYWEGELEVYALPGTVPAEEVLAEVGASHDRIWAIIGGGETGAIDEAGRRWLNEAGYRAWDAWFGPTQLALFGAPVEPTASGVQSVGANLGDRVTLLGYAIPELQPKPGGDLRLILRWQAKDEIDRNYKVFVHLVDSSGLPIAQRDSEPVGGSRPTMSWSAGEIITDRVGLLLPPGMVSGDYQLLVGMYDPETLERLPLLDDSGQVMTDSVSLGSLQIWPR
jgi:hypothetical protein